MLTRRIKGESRIAPRTAMVYGISMASVANQPTAIEIASENR